MGVFIEPPPSRLVAVSALKVSVAARRVKPAQIT
jgi:hypothetical protein